jgi:predicted tellurium resistance membrane protein TerC
MSEAIVGLVALTAMEVVLGIDNIVFITIVTGRLPEHQRTLAWRIGLGLAMLMRILLLFTLSWILSLQSPIFTLESLGFNKSWIVPGSISDPEMLHEWDHFWQNINGVSWRDLILFGGGLFLVAKSVHEIHNQLEHVHETGAIPRHASLPAVLFQICLLDIIFSLDSVITAVGMVNNMTVMVTAVVLSIALMIVFASRIGDFVHRHPTLKMLALSFLILIGVMLIAEGLGTHVNKGYIYFAMAFALVVEMLNLRLRHRHDASASNVI